MNLRLFVGLFACLFALGAVSDARACHHTIKSIMLSPKTACPGDDVAVTVNVELWGNQYNVQRWKSTSINGVCYDNPDHSSDNLRKFFSETITISAPDIPGTGTLVVKTFARDNCSWEKSRRSVDLKVIYCCPTCEDGDDCTVEQGDGFVTITCGETVGYLYDGEDGEDGEDGATGLQGLPGLSCTVERVGTCSNITCEDGTSAVVCDGEQGPPGEDGDDCTVEQDGDCAIVSCGGESVAVICDGVDGEDGTDGTSCWVEHKPRRSVIHCGESSAVVWNGLSCWDTNENNRKDFCSLVLRNMFQGKCPEVFVYEYECEEPEGLSYKACSSAKTYDGHLCSIEVGCVEYLMLTTDMTEDVAVRLCSFTEDLNDDGVVDILDCRGEDGEDGSIGPQGPGGIDGAPGQDGEDGTDGVDGVDGAPGLDGLDGSDGVDGVDGQDGTDGEGCSVVDNFDFTCTIVCSDSEVVVSNCGEGDGLEELITTVVAQETVEDVPNSTPCGAFGGVTIVAMLLPLGFMGLRSRRHH